MDSDHLKWKFRQEILLTAAEYLEDEQNQNAGMAYLILMKEAEAGENMWKFRKYFWKILDDKGAKLGIRRLAAYLLGEIRDKYASDALKQVLGVGFFTFRDADKKLCRIALESLRKIEGRF